MCSFCLPTNFLVRNMLGRGFVCCGLLLQCSAGICFASIQRKTSLQSGMAPFLSFPLPAEILNSASSWLFSIFPAYLVIARGCSLSLVSERNSWLETRVWTKICLSPPRMISGGKKQGKVIRFHQEPPYWDSFSAGEIPLKRVESHMFKTGIMQLVLISQ